jgi:hypothetical protein
MGHHITGIIARSETLKGLEGRLSGQPSFALVQGFAFMPLDYENLDDITGIHQGKAISSFVYLTEPLLELLCVASRSTELAYIETEYFGGNGGQGAVLFLRSEMSFGPDWADDDIGPINKALSSMGVIPKPDERDAFEAVGLGSYRSNEAFREEATAV